MDIADTRVTVTAIIITALHDIQHNVNEVISSAGLRVLLSAQKTMNTQGKMAIRNANCDTMDIFEVTGFSDILTVE